MKRVASLVVVLAAWSVLLPASSRDLESRARPQAPQQRRGTFGFIDVSGGKLVGDRKLECELTVKGGQVVWDLNGISRPLWTEMPK